MSESGAKVIARPVGNSPGPDSIVSATRGQLLTCRPDASRTVTMIWQSSVASVSTIVGLSASSRSPVAVVAGDVGELVDVAALRPADGGRARRVQLMAQLHQFRH